MGVVTGTGASPVVAKIANYQEMLTVVVLSQPEDGKGNAKESRGLGDVYKSKSAFINEQEYKHDKRKQKRKVK